MIVKLIAKRDFEAINFWQETIPVKKGDVYKGNVLTTDSGFKMVCIDFGGTTTPYEVRFIKEFFDVEGEL